MIVRFNERALATLGFDAPTIAVLRHLLHQTGSVMGAPTLPDVVDGQAQDLDPGMLAAQVAELAKQVESLRVQIDSAADNAELRKEVEALRVVIESGADAAELRKRLHALDIESAFPSAPTDWERPGKIGATTPNTGKFTTLTTTDKASLNPANADVELKPTGTGKVTINPATLGSMDNVSVGGTTPAAGAFSTLSTTATVGVGNATNNGATLSPTVWQRGYSTVPQYRYICNHVASGMLGWGSDGAGAMIFGQPTGSTGAESTRWLTLDGSGAAVARGFGCNGKAAQAAAASGGTLAGVISALVANGILSS